MAYRDDIANLGADHHWPLEDDSLDEIGSADGTDTSITYTNAAIAEDASNSAQTNATSDRISIPTTTTINNSAQTRKAVCGWFMVTQIQEPPKRIYGEGDDSTAFQFILSFGNSVLFEVFEPTNFMLQVIADRVLQINRPYHLCGIFEGSGFADEIRFYLDGVKQTLAAPDPPAPGSADLNSRGVAEFGDPAGTVGVAGTAILLEACTNGRYNHWATFDGADAVLTDTEVRVELFEKGVLPFVTISSDTQPNMQTALDALADTVRGNEPLNIRVEAVSGGGDFSLDADNITHDALASCHVQYTGTADTFTWRNTNGSDASIGSAPFGGTLVIATEQTLTITILDASDNSPIQGARVYLEAAAGGDLAEGTVIINDLTNASGVVTVQFDYTNPQPVTGKVRKGTSTPLYKTGIASTTLTATPLDATLLLERDE